MIVFVGEKPSKKNKDPNVPFVGTKSYRTLLGWIADMDINISDVKLENVSNLESINTKYTYIALGDIAYQKLSKFPVKLYKLPHPSGLNRKLNDKKWLKNELKVCRKWLNE